MRYIVNATFTINVSRTDIGITENMKLYTTQEILDETTNELGLIISEYMDIEPIHWKLSKAKLKISSAKRRLLSSTDIKLLNVAYVHKRNCILITDDKQIRIAAKQNKIKCYTTPQYIAYMIKNKLISIKEGITFLKNLKKIYIRPKDIDAVLKRIKIWKVR